MSRNIKEDIDSRLELLIISDEMKENISKNKNEEKKPSGKHYFCGAIAACLIIVFSVATIGNTTFFTRVMEVIDGTYEEKIITPIGSDGKSDSYEGIHLEAAGAYSDGDNAVVYIALAGEIGNRLDETIEFENMNIFNEEEKSVEGWRFDNTSINHDKNYTIVRIMIDGKEIDGKNLSIELGNILSKSCAFDKYLITTDLNEYIKGKTETIDKYAYTYNSEMYGDNHLPRLKPDVINIPLTTGDASTASSEVMLSNVGVIGDSLIVQTKIMSNSLAQNKIDLEFVPKDGEFEGISYSTSYFSIDSKGEIRNLYGIEGNDAVTFYCEDEILISDLIDSGTTLDDMSMYIMVNQMETSLKGDWEIDFDIKNAVDTRHADVDLDINNCNIRSVSLSPIGITVRGYTDEIDYNPFFDVSAMIGDTSIVLDSSSSSCSMSDDESKDNLVIRFYFRNITEVEKIDSIFIDGKEIELK